MSMSHTSDRIYKNTFTAPADWEDDNGHMNMGYYLVAFDEFGTDYFYDEIGVAWEYRHAHNKSMFTLAANIDFVVEAMTGDTFRIDTLLLDCDYKRLHYINLMIHEESGDLISTNECLAMHVDMEIRRSDPFPDDMQRKFEALLAEHKKLKLPTQTFRKLGIRR